MVRYFSSNAVLTIAVLLLILKSSFNFYILRANGSGKKIIF